ncbi:YdcF family protein [Gottfriedia endophytica]|uniref:YdcF family protein n=1 Tax=Gottfriedia endophytica TaxID=2820819 RepID=UPI001FD8671E|nr:YdcF family protein [Gottfriedia endophytica]
MFFLNKYVVWSICIVGIVLVSMFLFTSFLVFRQYQEAAPKNADYLIVLGARVKGEKPSKSLKNRIKVAANYANSNPNTVVIVSGGKGKGEKISEAECMERELIQLGIQKQRIIKEDQSTNTYQNFIFSKRLLPKGAKIGIVVSNDYHLYRAKKMARKVGLNVYGLPAKTPLKAIPNAYLREPISILKAILLKQM